MSESKKVKSTAVYVCTSLTRYALKDVAFSYFRNGTFIIYYCRFITLYDVDLSEDLLKKSQSPSPSPWLSSPSPSPAKVDLSPSPDLSTTSLLTTRNSAMKLFRTVSSDVIEECRVASLV